MIRMVEIIFKEEFKETSFKKSVLSFCVLIFVTYSFIPNYNHMNFNVMIQGIILTSGLYSLMYALSKLKDKKLRLWKVLPIDSKVYVNIIVFIIWIKIFVLKLLPFILGLILKIKETNKYVIINVALMAIVSYLVSVLVAYLVILISNKGFKFKISCKTKGSSSFANSSYLLMKREGIRLFENNIIWINHFAYIVFILFFIINALNNGPKELAPYLLILTFLSSTSSISYSSDKDALNFYKIMPINKYNVYMVKFIFNIAISTPMAIGSFILLKSYFSSKFSLVYFIVYGLIITTALKLYIDCKNPILNWDHVKQIFENKRRYKITFITVLAMLPIAIIMEKFLIISILWSVLTLICIIFIYNRSKNFL